MKLKNQLIETMNLIRFVEKLFQARANISIEGTELTINISAKYGASFYGLSIKVGDWIIHSDNEEKIEEFFNRHVQYFYRKCYGEKKQD